MLATGCSSLGLTLFPTGHFLTDQAKDIAASSPTHAYLHRELNRSVLPAHYIEPGDSVLIEPVDLESDIRLPIDQTVLADGSLDLGAYGRAVVAGLTLEQAEQLIERTIIEGEATKPEEKRKAYEGFHVNIRLVDSVHRFYVLGEVNSPGSYPLAGYETVLDGILAAGGLTSEAAPCDLLLVRPTTPCECRVTLPVCYREITQLGDTTTNYQLRPGDRIYVATRSCCDEFMFWRATTTCDRCRKCQTACQHPETTTSYYPITPAETELALPPLAQSIPSLGTSEMIVSEQTMSGSDQETSSEQSSRITLTPDSKTQSEPSTSGTSLSPILDGQLHFEDLLRLPNLELPKATH